MMMMMMMAIFLKAMVHFQIWQCFKPETPNILENLWHFPVLKGPPLDSRPPPATGFCRRFLRKTPRKCGHTWLLNGSTGISMIWRDLICTWHWIRKLGGYRFKNTLRGWSRIEYHTCYLRSHFAVWAFVWYDSDCFLISWISVSCLVRSFPIVVGPGWHVVSFQKTSVRSECVGYFWRKSAAGYLTRPFPSFVTCYVECFTVGVFPRKALTESRFLDEWLAAKFWRCCHRFSRGPGLIAAMPCSSGFEERSELFSIFSYVYFFS